MPTETERFGIAERVDNETLQTFTLYVCPNWTGERCECEQPAHRAYHYPVDPPESMPGMVKLGREGWQERAVEHAIAAEIVARGGAATAAATLADESVQTSAQTDQDGEDASDGVA